MTKGQCRTAITQNKQNIRQYNSQIAQLKNDIDELNRVKGKIVELQNTLADCKGASKAKLDSTTGLNNVSHKIPVSYTHLDVYKRQVITTRNGRYYVMDQNSTNGT